MRFFVDFTHQLNTPPEQSRLEVLFIGKLPALDDGDGVDNRETAVEFATGHIIVQILKRIQLAIYYGKRKGRSGTGRHRLDRSGTIGTHALEPVGRVGGEALGLEVVEELLADDGENALKAGAGRLLLVRAVHVALRDGAAHVGRRLRLRVLRRRVGDLSGDDGLGHGTSDGGVGDGERVEQRARRACAGVERAREGNCSCGQFLEGEEEGGQDAARGLRAKVRRTRVGRCKSRRNPKPRAPAGSVAPIRRSTSSGKDWSSSRFLPNADILLNAGPPKRFHIHRAPTSAYATYG